jgi:hypothetical protein
MTHIAGHDHSKTLLLAKSIDEYVGQDNPVRFIDAFVDGLDLCWPMPPISRLVIGLLSGSLSRSGKPGVPRSA